VSSIAFIGLGSNIGDGLQTLQLAWKSLGEIEGIKLQALSSPYLSAPVGMASSNWFTNAAGRLASELSATELLQAVLAVEADFGRKRDSDAQGYQDRTLDLDILYFNQRVVDQHNLVLPHPFLGERLFVLEPLAEIAGDFRDPVDGRSPAEKMSTLRQAMASGSIPLQEIRKGEWP
jgi:2-amino-4-hydroxy-6-hydroxymethyldihydropteridine diphosphokinase